jgi:peptidoglycan/xylan/chitin deacetylase (PgdA/CDA1 family)
MPRAIGTILSQLSVFAVIATSLAVGTVASLHVAQHYGWDRGPVAVAAATHPSAPAPTDPAARQEAGLVDPTALQSSLATIPNDDPSAAILRRGTLKGGVWLPILMYHYVRIPPGGGDRQGYELSVPPDVFEAQMKWLKDHGYTTLTMKEVDQVLMGQKPPPARAVALTFDDAYQDFYTAAAPVLKANGLTATNYVPTQLVGDTAGAYMTWPEVEELDQQGFEMAAHSQFHVDVSTVDAQRAKIEIFGARADLEQHLGHQVIDWAYPYGAFNYQSIKLVAAAGYFSAATTQSGAFHDTGQMPLLTRVRVSGGETLAQFEASITKP